jgi:hypothetical protein
MKQLHVRPKRICNDQSVTPVVLRAGNGMPVAKSIHLFRVQRVNCEPTLNERLDQRSARDLDPNRNLLDIA